MVLGSKRYGFEQLFANDVSDNPPYHPVFLISNFPLFELQCFRGILVTMPVVRILVRSPVSNTTETQNNFLVAEPLVNTYIHYYYL